ncbi:hypothetical protein WM40_13185 [Robbsia andropogonis]|uniref:DMT family transporter n=1 Tax=Robbsia andropogonis TaxID=28092 RepID=A0A0F5JZD0_9BURK|nr:DMT family transporter [Robbsia andropogonis]KKB63183.1 hypothetical protein WM40_13185 [Robbsia andropogonis]MCP1117596.1 DMT family transporter [Robbsia andropogonis]MCP1127062.1 DMT family transporter [Robbsia andropogonis]
MYVIIALLAGAMLPLQAIFNARMGNALGSPIWGAMVSAIISSIALSAVGFSLTGSIPRGTHLQTLPVWAWLGGFCGVITLAGVAACTPRLGAAAMVAFVVAGQVAFSIALDCFGLFGVSAQPITLQRAIAAVLVLAGAALIR